MPRSWTRSDRRGQLSDTARRALVIVACIAMAGGATAVVLYQAFGVHGTETGIPSQQLTRFTLTCLNPDCPGRHEEQDLYGQTLRDVPYRFDQKLPGGYTDWPVPCPKCVEKFGPEYTCSLDPDQFAERYHYDLPQSQYTGRSAFHLVTCVCGAKWILRDATRKADFQCPGCGLNVAQ